MKYQRTLFILAGLMLLLAILPTWPYVYYQLLRIVVCITAAIGAYHAFETERTGWVWVLSIIAILFNPIAPIHLDKETWVVPDLISAFIMFVAAAKLKLHT